MKFLIDDKIPYIRPYIERWGTCRYMAGAAISPADMADVDCLVTRTRTHVGAELLASSPVRLVVTATIGFDHIEAEALAARGVRWTNCPGCNATSVAQYVREALRPLLAERCAGRVPTLGIVGCGHVGNAVLAMAQQEGWRVLVSDPPLGLHDDLSEADAISYHVPLTHSGMWATYHMASHDFFRSLRRQPIIINAARGGVVDEEALLQAMDEGRVGPIVIDTWETEPTPRPALLRRAHIATPHIAGYSANGKANATLMTLRAIVQAAPSLGWQLPHVGLPDTAAQLLTTHYGGTLPHVAPYSPLTDSEALKAHPELFEQLRGNYPLRLED